jgi:hypothetical protein
MRFLKSFGQFWYDFVIGDDWKISVAVVIALTFTTVLLLSGALSDHAVAVLGGVAVVVGFCVTMAIDVRTGRK